MVSEKNMFYLKKKPFRVKFSSLQNLWGKNQLNYNMNTEDGSSQILKYYFFFFLFLFYHIKMVISLTSCKTSEKNHTQCSCSSINFNNFQTIHNYFWQRR